MDARFPSDTPLGPGDIDLQQGLFRDVRARVSTSVEASSALAIRTRRRDEDL